MTLLAGQSWNSSCPYFWNHCSGSSCDGCEADRGQGRPVATPPWAEGTTVAERHAKARAAAESKDSLMAQQLWQLEGWKN